MAIENMQGKVSMTGMVNSKPPKIEAPDMSNIKMPTAPKFFQVSIDGKNSI